MQSINSSVNVFPNPATNQFVVEGSLFRENSRVEICNTLGEKIYASEFNKQITIDSKKFPKGIYFVRVSDSQNQLTEKLVIE